MDTRISIQNIFIRNLNVRLCCRYTHTHTTPHMINLVAGRWYQSNILPDLRIRKKYNDSPHLRRPEVYYVSFIKNYQLINSFISRQMPHCKLFIPYLQIRKIILLLILCLYFNICIYYFVFDLYCKLCKVWSIFSRFCL